MALISKPYTFTVGATIIASQHNSNFDTLYNDYNGNITNANLAAAFSLDDSKIAQIATYGKVKGSSITQIDTLNSSGGTFPLVNLPLITTGYGGTGSTANANAASGVVVLDANSKISVAQLGAWVDKSASYGAQQATTDGIVTAQVSGAGNCTVTGFTDGSSNPTTQRAKDDRLQGSATITFPVRKNDYWKITFDTGTPGAVYWLPWGS